MCLAFDNDTKLVSNTIINMWIWIKCGIVCVFENDSSETEKYFFNSVFK